MEKLNKTGEDGEKGAPDLQDAPAQGGVRKRTLELLDTGGAGVFDPTVDFDIAGRDKEREKPAEGKPENTERAERREPMSEEDRIQLQDKLINSFANFVDRIKYRLDLPEVPVKNKEAAVLEYEHANGAYEELTGRDLDADAKARAIAEAEQEGHRIKTKKEHFSVENVGKIKERERHEMWTAGIKAAWDKLPEQEKNQWKEKSSRDETTKDKQDGGARQFARGLEAGRKQLEKRGFVFSRDVYYKLFEDGYDPRTVKTKWFGAKIEVKKTEAGKLEVFRADDFEAKKQAVQNNFDNDLSRRAAEKMKKTCAEGKSRWLKRKIKAGGDIVLENTKEYQADVISQGASADIIDQTVRPEVLIPEEKINGEEKDLEEEYEARTSKLAEVATKTAKQFGLKEGQLKSFDEYIEGETNFLADIFIPQDILGALRDKKRQIEWRRKSRRRSLMAAKITRARKNLLRELAGL